MAKDEMMWVDGERLDAMQREVLKEARQALAGARSKTYAALNAAMVGAYWEIGKQISEAIGERAEYGKGLLAYLSKHLTEEFGKGFTVRNLQTMRQFYVVFPNAHTLCAELSWSHYRLLMRIENEERRLFYMHEAVSENWSVRQLDRQIHSFYYERLLATQSDEGKEEVHAEIQQTQPVAKADDIIRDPYVLEFLDLKQDPSLAESDLESALITKLTDFLLELGKGFCFVARQKRISEGVKHCYVDLVFYNYLLKCFVLIDLKTGELTHQDVGQMDFYTRLYQERFSPEGDNPPIGIILCSEKSDAVAKYSVLADKDNLFASKYLLYLPTEEELAAVVREGREEVEAAGEGSLVGTD